MAANGLGIDVAAAEPALRAQLGLAENAGLVVTAAPEESSGAKAGIKVHDVVVEIAGEAVGDPAKLVELIDASAEKPIRLRLWRSGKTVEIEVTPKKPEVAKVRWSNLINQNVHHDVLAYEETYRIGVTLAEADDTLRAHLRLAAGEGLVVTEVIADSPAQAAKLAQHDVLTVLDGKRLTTVEAINAQIQEIKEKSVDLRVLRGGEEFVVQIAPRKTQEAAFADVITYWDVKNCQRCHDHPWQTVPHRAAARLLRADKSAWIDAHSGKAYLYHHLLPTEVKEAALPAEAATGQAQIDALKSQLAEMQKTLAALEATLAPAQQKAEEKKE
jgi:predicted metalloprotease with PDZ domain